MSFFKLTTNLHFRATVAKNIVIQYQDLKNEKNLTDVIEAAYGPKGLGILFVDGIPDYYEARCATLPQIGKLGRLPEQTLKKYARPEIYHSLGWSKGVQQFNGKFDNAKGSYYVNCCTDQAPSIPVDKRHLFSEDELKMNVANKWVDELPELQKNVKFLSKIMIHTGTLLARQIDRAAQKAVSNYQKNHLTRIIEEGTGHIGRMLHYYPFEEKGATEDDWCGWHNDHGALTALTSAMYIDAEGNEVDVSATNGGLFAKNRFAEMGRIGIPKKMLAFQLGETAQIISGGYLEATPHCVVRADDVAGKGISRDTFALFMEPNWTEELSVPKGIDPSAITSKEAYKIPQLHQRWKNGVYFKDFHHATIKLYS